MQPSSQLAMAFGPLEAQVLEALWERATPSTVHDIEAQFPGCAYSTLMTTLDRLFQKGVLARAKRSRQFVYRTILTRDEQIVQIAESWFATLLPSDTKLAGPVLSQFVDAVVKRDERLLNDLEQCLHERRRRLRQRLTWH